MISQKEKENMMQQLIDEMKESRNEYRVKAVAEMFIALCNCNTELETNRS